MQAIKLGLTSSQYLDMYQDFIGNIEAMRVIKKVDELEFEFSRYLDQQAKGINHKASVSKTDLQDIKESVATLSPRWIKSLPATLTELDGARSINFSQWRDEILDGARGCPEDLTLDYYLFLLAKKYL